MRPMPERRAGGARGEGSFLGTVRSGGSVAAALAAEGPAGPLGFPDFYQMKRKPSRVVTKARIDKAASVYIQARRAASQSVILDLGCGAKKVPGAFGVDGISLPGVDLVHNLGETPYPLPEHCADEIHLNHVL